MLKIFRFIVLAAICIFAISACSNDAVQGSGKITSQTRNVQAFDKIDVSGNINVLVATGKTPKVTVTTDDNLQKVVLTQAKDDTLFITLKPGIKIEGDHPPVVTIRATKLVGVKASGSGKLNITNLLSDEFSINSTGRYQVVLRGKVKYLHIRSSGSAKVNTLNLSAEHVKASITGSAILKVEALSSLNAKISGEGLIEYAGNPKITQDISGEGKIKPVKNA